MSNRTIASLHASLGHPVLPDQPSPTNVIELKMDRAQSKIDELERNLLQLGLRFTALETNTNEAVGRLKVLEDEGPEAVEEAERVDNELIGHEQRIAALETKTSTLKSDGGGRKKSRKRKTKKKRTKRRRR